MGSREVSALLPTDNSLFGRNKPAYCQLHISVACVMVDYYSESGPVGLFSRTLTPVEKRHSATEKKAYAIAEALKTDYFFMVNHFRLATGQQSVALMFGNQSRSKIKNEMVQGWGVGLTAFQYNVVYCQGHDSPVADAPS